jgi:ClpP class serine protease
MHQKPISEIDDHTLILADVAAKAVDQVKHSIKELLLGSRSEEEADRLADVLSSGVWTHDYPIGVEEARALGLKVSTDMPMEVYDLMSLYPQTGQRRPSVFYIPVPYRARDAQPNADRPRR